MSGTSANTPCQVNPKKRELPSPEDITDTKKNRINSGSMSESDLAMSTSTSNKLDAGTDPEVSRGRILSDTPTQLILDDTHLQQIATLMKDTFQPQVTGVIQQSFQSQVADLINSIVAGILEGLNLKIGALEKENKELKQRVMKLEDAADQAEQYSRRNCLKISGVPENDASEESTDDLVIKLARAIDVDLSLQDIDRSHRLGKSESGDNARPRPWDIVVKFATYRTRARFYKARVLTKDRGYRGVFVNEHLTKTRNNILYQARRRVKSKQLKSAWSFDGFLFVRHHDEKVQRIYSVTDLPEYVPLEPESDGSLRRQ